MYFSVFRGSHEARTPPSTSSTSWSTTRRPARSSAPTAACRPTSTSASRSRRRHRPGMKLTDRVRERAGDQVRPGAAGAAEGPQQGALRADQGRRGGPVRPARRRQQAADGVPRRQPRPRSGRADVRRIRDHGAPAGADRASRPAAVPAAPAAGPGAAGGGARAWPGTSSSRPWLLGLMGITAVPMLLSLYLSFTNYDVLIAAVRGRVGRAATTTSGCSPPTRPTGTRCRSR